MTRRDVSTANVSPSRRERCLLRDVAPCPPPWARFVKVGSPSFAPCDLGPFTFHTIDDTRRATNRTAICSDTHSARPSESRGDFMLGWRRDRCAKAAGESAPRGFRPSLLQSGRRSSAIDLRPTGKNTTSMNGKSDPFTRAGRSNVGDTSRPLPCGCTRAASGKCGSHAFAPFPLRCRAGRPLP